LKGAGKVYDVQVGNKPVDLKNDNVQGRRKNSLAGKKGSKTALCDNAKTKRGSGP